MPADIKTGSKYLYQIELAVAKIQDNQHVSANLETIRKMINLEFKANCKEVILTNNKTANYFFGAHVFPTESELSKIADTMIKVEEKLQFDYCREFVIELDSKLIYDINATPQEITAVILHEIGHKAYSKKALIRSKMLFINSIGKYGFTIGTLAMSISPIKFLLYNAIVVTFSNNLRTYIKLKNEKDADSFAVKYGYGADLYSLLNKLTMNYGKGLSMIRPHGYDNFDEEKAVMKWTVKNMMEFTVRRNAIQKELRMQLKSETSPYGKDILRKQIESIDRIKINRKGLSPKKKEAIMNESIKSFMEMNTKGYSYLELDEIEVEISRIETHEDKLYLITRLYRNISLAQKSLEQAEADNKKSTFSKNSTVQYKDFINKCKALLKQVKGYKIKETDYGVFIQYPKGDYEE